MNDFGLLAFMGLIIIALGFAPWMMVALLRRQKRVCNAFARQVVERAQERRRKANAASDWFFDIGKDDDANHE